MKLLAALFCALSCLGAILYRPRTAQDVRVIVLGNHQGNLSPCGCSSPMLGGILREATEVRSLQKLGPNVVIDSGNMSGGDSEQEVLKAWALSETLASLNTSAVNLGFKDSKFGGPELGNLQSLLKDALISGSVEGSRGFSLEGTKESEGFLIGGVSINAANLARQIGGRPVELDGAVQKVLDEAAGKGLKTILMVDGDKEEALQIARDHPALDLIVYNSTSRPGEEAIRVGKTMLVSPGERGEYLVEVAYPENGAPTYLPPISLTEDVGDDAKAARFYKRYLGEVEDHKLWENLPRRSGKQYAGAEACSQCHTDDYRIWKGSKHAQALFTLSSRGHAKDPECLRCHVTGAEFKTGFRSLQTTPHLAFVGCESCHGPAAEHAAHPYLFRLPKIKPAMCLSCHEELNSPLFNFARYWPKIRHGIVEKGWKPHP